MLFFGAIFRCYFSVIFFSDIFHNPFFRAIFQYFFSVLFGEQQSTRLSQKAGKHYPNIFSSLAIASTVFSLEPKAVILNQPSPFLPKPEPGVPTISASFNSL